MNTPLSSLKTTIISFFFLLIAVFGFGQTNPAAFPLSGGGFSFASQTASNTTYPTNMQGWTTGTNYIPTITTAAPGGDQALIANGTASTTGISNLGANGFNFLLTGSAQQVGEIVVALDATGRKNLLATWTAADNLATASRVNAIALQYRVGTSGTFTTVASSTYNTTGGSQKAAETFTNIAIPSACDNQAVVQLRWIYWEVSGAGGRDPIRLDDITVSSSAVSTTPTLSTTPSSLTGFTYVAGSGPSTNQTFSLQGANLDGTKDIDILPGDNWEVSADQSTWLGYTTGPLVIPTYNGASKTIYVRLKAGLPFGTYNNASNDIIAITTTYSVATSPNVAVTGSVSRNTITSTASGLWGTGSTWVGGIVPTSSDNVIIKSGHVVNVASVRTRDAGTTTTVDAGGTLSTDVTLTNNGSIAINGTFQLNGGGFLSSPPATYGSASTLIYNILNASYGVGSEWTGNSTTAGAGVPQNVTIQNGTALTMPNGSGLSRGLAGNMNIGAGSSLTLGNNPTNNDIYVAGNWTNSGTFSPNSRLVTFTGAAAQTITGATTFDYFTMNGAGGLTLASAVTVNQTFTLTLGKITLGSNNLTLGSAALFSGGNSNSYIITNGTGALVRTSVGPTLRNFPVGLAGSFTPLTISNTGTSTNLSLIVSAPPTNAVTTAAKIVNLQWNLTSGGAGAVADITFNWTTGNQGASYSANGQGELGNYTAGPNYAITSLGTMAGITKAVTGFALTTGSNKLVLGNTGAVYLVAPINDLCSNATNVIVDAAAISGTLIGADPTAGLTYAPTKNDVWYKFTPTNAGTHVINVKFTTGPDLDLDVFTSTCPSSGVGTFTAHTAGATSEILTASFSAGITYYIRVVDYNTNANAFTINITGPPATLSSNSTSTLTFGNQAPLTTSASQTFNVSGFALTGAPGVITLTAPNTNFQVSNNNSTWGATATVPYSTSTLSSTPVYVRFAPQSSGAKSGNVTLSGGGASAITVAVTGASSLPAPVATAATNILSTSFDANWNAVTGASAGYLLDVSTSPTFGTYASASLNEGFESGMVTGPYYSGNYTLGSGSWSFVNIYKGVSPNINSGSISCQLQGGSNASATSPTVNNAGTVSFYAKRGTNATNLKVQKLVGGITTTIDTIVLTTTMTEYSVAINDSSSALQVVFLNGDAVAYIDDVIISYTNSVPDFVTGYNAKPIAGQTAVTSNVSGLSPNTVYYYRLRSSDGAPSVNSNVIQVTTTAGITIWNGTIWSNGIPNANMKAVINGSYDMVNDLNNLPSITAFNLTVNNILVIKANKFVKITNELLGDVNGKITVESDANFLQTAVAPTNNYAGTFTVNRTANMKRLDYTYWGSPVSGQMLKAFSPGTVNTRFLTYNELNDTFSAVANPSSTPFAGAKGYAIRADNNYPVWTDPAPISAYRDFVGIFSGTPNNGDVSYTLAKSGAGYNLVGNPYASNIDFNKLVDTGAIEGTAYFWTNVNPNPTQQGSSYLGANYATYVYSSGGVPSQNGGIPKTPEQFIKVGQGFIIQAKNVGSLIFTNAMRDNGTGASKFINKGNKNSNSSIDRYWLKLITPNNNFNTILIAYPEGATNGFESTADAEQFGESSDSFYSVLNNYKLNIQGRQLPLINSDIIPLGLKGFESGTYKIAMVEKEGIFADGQNIYLKDNQTGTTVNLSESDYSFTANVGVTEGRFEIVYKNDLVLAAGNVAKDQIMVYRDGNDFVIKSETKKITELEMYDTGGRLLLKLKPNKTETRIDASAMVNGVYVLKMSRNGEISTKKISK